MGRGEGDGGASTLYDTPVSPAGRLFLRPELEMVIHCIFTFENPVDVDAVKAVLKSSLIKNSPRLRSLAVTERNGRQRWKELPEIDIDNHVIIVPEEEETGGQQTASRGDYEDDKENDIYINEYVGALPASMSREMPLWEMHVLPPPRRCLVLRFHHALGDGISLMALILASCERAGDPGNPITVPGNGGEGKRRAKFSLASSVIGVVDGAWRAMKAAWYTVVYSADLSTHAVCRKENKTTITGGEGVELLPRKLATLTLCLDDMKAVKSKLNAKMNDVFVGMISYGIAKYLKSKYSNEASKDAVITGLLMVNTRGESSKDLISSIRERKKTNWGNRLGYILLPIHLKGKANDPLDYVRKARAVLNRKKLSLEAHYSYKSGSLIMALFGSKVATMLNYKILSNISMTLSNVAGPLDAITLAKNRMTKIAVTTTSLPLPLQIHMLTYNGKAFLQVLAAADIIPDPELLCMYFQEALQEMKSKAMNAEDIEEKS